MNSLKFLPSLLSIAIGFQSCNLQSRSEKPMEKLSEEIVNVDSTESIDNMVYFFYLKDGVDISKKKAVLHIQFDLGDRGSVGLNYRIKGHKQRSKTKLGFVKLKKDTATLATASTFASDIQLSDSESRLGYFGKYVLVTIEPKELILRLNDDLRLADGAGAEVWHDVPIKLIGDLNKAVFSVGFSGLNSEDITASFFGINENYFAPVPLSKQYGCYGFILNPSKHLYELVQTK